MSTQLTDAPAARPHATTSTLALPRIPGPRPDRSIGLARLVGVEWRKQVNTRAGFWLLVSIGLITAGVLGIMFFVGGGAHSWGDYLLATATPLPSCCPSSASWLRRASGRSGPGSRPSRWNPDGSGSSSRSSSARC